MLSPAEVSGLSRALQGDAPVQEIRNPGGKISKPRPRRPMNTNPRHGNLPANGTFRRERGDPSRPPMNARPRGQRHAGHEPGNESGNDSRPPHPGNFRRDVGDSSRSPMNARPGGPRHAGPHHAGPRHAGNDLQARPGDERPRDPWKKSFRGGSGEPSSAPVNPRFGKPPHGGKDSHAPDAGQFRRESGDTTRTPINPRHGGPRHAGPRHAGPRHAGNDLQARPGDKRPRAPWKKSFRGGSGEPSSPPANPRFGKPPHGGKDSRAANAGRFRRESGDKARTPINPRHGGPRHGGPRHAGDDSRSPRPGNFRRNAGDSRPSSNKRPRTSSTKPRDWKNPQAPRK